MCCNSPYSREGSALFQQLLRVVSFKSRQAHATLQAKRGRVLTDYEKCLSGHSTREWRLDGFVSTVLKRWVSELQDMEIESGLATSQGTFGDRLCYRMLLTGGQRQGTTQSMTIYTRRCGQCMAINIEESTADVIRFHSDFYLKQLQTLGKNAVDKAMSAEQFLVQVWQEWERATTVKSAN